MQLKKSLKMALNTSEFLQEYKSYFRDSHLQLN